IGLSKISDDGLIQQPYAAADLHAFEGAGDEAVGRDPRGAPPALALSPLALEGLRQLHGRPDVREEVRTGDNPDTDVGAQVLGAGRRVPEALACYRGVRPDGLP